MRLRIDDPRAPVPAAGGAVRPSRCLELPVTAPDCIQPLFLGDRPAQLGAAVARKCRFVASTGGLYVAIVHAGVFGDRDVANFVYLTATMDAAIWGAELAVGDGRGRVYRVEPTGPFEHDPNLTDTRFRGNRTRSYRSRDPLRIVEEVEDWEGHPPEVIQEMLDNVARMNDQGIKAIND